MARRSEITFLSLPTPAVVEAVAGEWLAGAGRGSVLVDLSTNAPLAVRALGERVAAAGCHLLEAPLTGGAPGARARMLVFLVGGDEAVYQRCRPVVEVVRTGGAGNFYIDRMVEGLNQRGRPAHFALALAAKDAGLVAELAEQEAVFAPVAGEIARIFAAGVEAGLGERDWSDIVELLEARAGLHLPPKPDAAA